MNAETLPADDTAALRAAPQGEVLGVADANLRSLR